MKNRGNFPPGFEDDEKNLSVDFDGVIHDCSKGYYDGSCYGEPMPGAIESIKGLAEKYRIVVFTAKAKKSRPLVDGKTGLQDIYTNNQKFPIIRSAIIFIVHPLQSRTSDTFFYSFFKTIYFFIIIISKL